MVQGLEFLLAIAREKHFGRAAIVCGVTQPTLSAGLKRLENALGAMLVKRGSRFQGLTPEGELILDWARQIVGDFRVMREELRTLKEGITGNLRIATIPIALAMVPYLTTPFREKYPNVHFTVLSRTSAQILTMLDNLEADAGITYIENETLGRARAVPLYREHYRLLVGPDNVFANRDQVTWAELDQMQLCLLTSDMQNRRIIDSLLQKAGAKPSLTLESDSMFALFAHVNTGKWASIMPEKLARTLGLIERIHAIPLVKPDATHTVGLVVSGREPSLPIVRALIKEAQQIARTLH